MKKLKFIISILLFLTSGASAGYCPVTGCFGELEYPYNCYNKNNTTILRQDILGQYYLDGQSYQRNYRCKWDEPTQADILRQEILQEIGIW